MATRTRANREDIIYPDSDGKPMADNTLQFEWIVRIQGNLDDQYRDDPNVLVVGDLLWYPVRGHPEISAAPDTMVVFGRPKGHRRSYIQFREGNVGPKVTFEVLSHNNTKEEMNDKLDFYDRYGVEEYYLYDPYRGELFGWLRQDGRLRPIDPIDGWVSPLLRIRFDLSGLDLVIFKEDGQPFLSFLELAEREEEARRQSERAQRSAAREKRQREKAEQETERLRKKLRELGVDPDKAD